QIFAREIREKLADDDRLLVIGGDGTLSNVLQVTSDVTIGYIPAGTGNDFARGINLSADPLEALARFEVSNGTTLHIIRYRINQQEKLALNNVGIGLDAEIVATNNQSKSKKQLNRLHLGKFSYILTLFKLLFQKNAFPVKISTDDYTMKVENAFLLTVTNHPFFGGGIPIWPDASVHSDKIDVILIKRYSIIKLLYLLVLIVTKKQMSHPDIVHLKTSYLLIKLLHPEYLQADGEHAPPKNYELEFQTTKHQFWV
ncbi:MAG: diacylglycerol kinase family lipid kinase, partial [Streptococcaceae bacterium]|nr:diacylglycerol kinase family lipid kinase [Streptococcaceae bacterium]